LLTHKSIKSVVAVEDNSVNQTFLLSALKRFGIEDVEVAASGDKAIELILRKRPDVVLMDINIDGDKNGFEVAQILKDSVDTPVIYMTASEDDELNQRIVETTPYGFLKKPVRLDDLKSTIEIAFSRFQVDKELNESQKRLKLSTEILSVLNSMSDNAEAIKKIISHIKSILGFSAVAMRIPEKGHFPYHSVQGFSDEFVHSENDLRPNVTEYSKTSSSSEKQLECLCGMVSRGEYSEANEFFTPHGSFWCGDMNLYGESIMAENCIESFRNTCGKMGYNSVILTPIYVNKEIIGILQINDVRKNAVDLETVLFIEELSVSIGLAISRKMEMKKLAIAGERLIEAQSVGKIASWEYNPLENVFEWSDGLMELFNIPDSPNKIWSYIHKDDIEMCRKILAGSLAKEKAGVPSTLEFRLHNPKDHRKLFYARSAWKAHNGILKGITQDITLEKQRELESEDSRSFLHSIITALNTGLVVLDADKNRVIDINDEALRLYGLEREKVLKFHSSTLLSSKYFKSNIKLPLLTEEMISNQESLLKRSDGTLLPVSKVIMRATQNNREQWVVILFDITQRKQLEDQLVQGQKMESIGSLAAGIAHEINTPIQYIGDNIHFLKDSFNTLAEVLKKYREVCKTVDYEGKENSPLSRIKEIDEESDIDFLLDEAPEAITQSIDGVQRVATIVKAMKKFSHPEQDEMTLCDINEIVENSTIVCRNEWKYVADLKTNFAEDIPQVAIHSNDISQVVLNMVVNASHAIEDVTNGDEKGTITVTTRYDEESVIIDISDTGSGIKPENYSKIFDHFFTTKEIGKGTGQGLSMAYTIITDKHNGKLTFTSEENVGTTFTITLPRSEQENA
jgi:PAS domain S-box-containing protein